LERSTKQILLLLLLRNLSGHLININFNVRNSLYCSFSMKKIKQKKITWTSGLDGMSTKKNFFFFFFFFFFFKKKKKKKKTFLFKKKKIDEKKKKNKFKQEFLKIYRVQHSFAPLLILRDYFMKKKKIFYFIKKD